MLINIIANDSIECRLKLFVYPLLKWTMKWNNF